MKSTQLFMILLLSIITNSISGQHNNLVINQYIKLPADSIQSKALLSSLTQFISSAGDDNKLNKKILPEQEIETYILLDEMPSLKSENSDNTNSYQYHLNNIMAIENDKFLIQLSYIKADSMHPLLRAEYTIIAHPKDNSYLFSSPLIRNTQDWNTHKVGNNTFHYKRTINKDNTNSYQKNVLLFDEKLNSKNKSMDYYCGEDIAEVLRLFGVNYKLDYNGRSYLTFSSTNGNHKLIVSGEGDTSFNQFDPHDLWHARLSLVKSRREVNKHVDEACAYLYGGSWGISWDTILTTFKNRVANKKDIDWTEIKEQKLDFGDSPRKHLIADYVVTALIVEKLEAEQGFSAVWKLLDCGVYEKGNENYYTVLESLLGISKEEYNEYVWKLIQDS